MDLDLLRQLCETPGASGREERVRALIEETIKGLFDEVRTDTMGSLICTRRAKTTRRTNGATRVMLAAHMDEIGFYVRHVDEKGFLWVNPAGGFDPRNLFSRRVLVCCDRGDYPGVMNPGGKPIHISSAEERKKVPEVSEFFIDLGMEAKAVAKKVKVGDFVIMNEPKGEGKHACEVVIVFTVQEEVGLRGATAAANALEADIGVALDTTLACDTSRSTRPWPATRLACPTPSRSPATAMAWRLWCRTRP
jgi:endoglucanase